MCFLRIYAHECIHSQYRSWARTNVYIHSTDHGRAHHYACIPTCKHNHTHTHTSPRIHHHVYIRATPTHAYSRVFHLYTYAIVHTYGANYRNCIHHSFHYVYSICHYIILYSKITDITI